MTVVTTESEAQALLLGLTGADAKVRALTERIADAMCDGVLEHKPEEAPVLAEAAVRAAAIFCSICARQGNESAMMRLGAMILLRLADETDLRRGHDALLAPMPARLQ